MIEGTAKCLQRNLAKVPTAERDALIEVAATAAAGRLRAVASLMKNAAFAGEEEWRLVTHDVRGPRVAKKHLVPLQMGYRVVDDRVVPYQDLVFDLLPATEIVLGWSASMAPDDQGLAELVQNTCGQLEVRRSTVPVRR